MANGRGPEKAPPRGLLLWTLPVVRFPFKTGPAFGGQARVPAVACRAAGPEFLWDRRPLTNLLRHLVAVFYLHTVLVLFVAISVVVVHVVFLNGGGDGAVAFPVDPFPEAQLVADLAE